MAQDSYTSTQVAEIIGLSKRRLLSWIERGFVSPSIQDAEGRGSKRLWSYSDLIRCAVVKILSGTLSVDTLRLVEYVLRDEKRLTPDQILTIPVADWDNPKMLILPVATVDNDRYGPSLPLQTPLVIQVFMDKVHFWVKERVARKS